MKKLLVLSMVILAVSTQAAVICRKDSNGRWYPKNATAIKIASLLGVKTCSGHRFKEVVKKLGETSNVRAAKKRNSVEDTLELMKK